jgi:Skp family chaperone for outer membrane proteins
MKNTILIFTILFWGICAYAQEQDTTKIKIGDTKIIIIDKNEDQKTQDEKAELARKEFEKLLQEKEQSLQEQNIELEKLQKELESNQKNFESQQDEQLKKDAELKMKDLNKQVEEHNKRVEDLQKEVDALEKGIENLEDELGDNSDNDTDIDEDWDDDNFDWHMDEDWHGDWDNLSPFGHKKKFRGHWAGFELGLNNYVNSDGSFTMKPEDSGFELRDGNSWTFVLNFIELNVPFGRNAGLVTGLGTSWNNYHFRNNVNVFEDSLGVIVASPENVKSYNKNSLHAWNFSVPFIFEFQIPSGHSSPGVYLGLGVVGTLKVNSWGKVEYSQDGVRFEERRVTDFQENTFRYGLTARMGFSFLRFFVNYDLVPLFKKDHGPELYPVSFGITLLSF